MGKSVLPISFSFSKPLLATLGILVLVVGTGVGIFAANHPQEIRQHAATKVPTPFDLIGPNATQIVAGTTLRWTSADPNYSPTCTGVCPVLVTYYVNFSFFPLTAQVKDYGLPQAVNLKTLSYTLTASDINFIKQLYPQAKNIYWFVNAADPTLQSIQQSNQSYCVYLGSPDGSCGNGGQQGGGNGGSTPTFTPTPTPMLLSQPTHVGYHKNLNLTEFALGNDGNLYSLTQTGSGGNITWGSWTNMGTPLYGVKITALTVGQHSDGRQEVFAVGSDTHIWHSIQQGANSTSWSSWNYLPNPTSSVGISPSIVVKQEADGHLTLFGIGTDGHLYYTSEANNSYGWTPTWTNLQGNLSTHAGSLTVGRNQSGTLDVFVLDSSGQAWHNYQLSPNNDNTSNWSSWSKQGLGGTFTSIIAAKEQNGKLDVFGLGTDNHIWNDIQTSAGSETSWTTWNNIGGNIQSFSVGTNQDGRLEIFAIASDKQLWHNWETSPNAQFSSNGWSALGGGFSSQRPDVANLSNGNLDVLTLDTFGQVWQNYQTNLTGWSSFGNLKNPGFPFVAIP